MNQTISLPKSVFEELVARLNRLETIVFGKSQSKTTDEYIKLSPAAKKRYKKMDEDFKNGKNIYVAHSTEEFYKQLGIWSYDHHSLKAVY